MITGVIIFAWVFAFYLWKTEQYYMNPFHTEDDDNEPRT